MEMKNVVTNVELSAPLHQLKNEHRLLREEMDRFYEITEEIEYESGPLVIELFTELYERVSEFTGKLSAHSKREDDGLFPMMARHLGENDRTIETMEYEHHKAEGHLRDFLDEAAEMGEVLDEYDAQTITVHAVQAYTTLTQHFAKEENMLFPLAEKLLSSDEFNELVQMFKND